MHEDVNTLLSEALSDDDLCGDLELIKGLLERGADANIKANGESPLSIAVSIGNFELVKLLIAHGARVTDYLLYWAALHNMTDAVSLFIEHEACVTPTTGSSAIHEAVRHRNHEVLRLLLQEKVRQSYLNCFNEISRSPLMVAVANDDEATAHLLLDAGADVNALDLDRAGSTALVAAVDNKNYDMVCTLLRAGADPHLSSPGRPSAWDTAKRFEREPHVRIKLAIVSHDPSRIRRS